MKTKDHALLAGYITRNASNHELEKHKKAFVLGSIAPDINVFTHIKGHKFKNSMSLIEKRFNKLIKREKWRSREYYKFGKIIHYLADYFTFAHNPYFSGTIRMHRAYEKELHSYFIEYLTWMRFYSMHPIPKEDVMASIIKRHKEYMNSEISVENDCRFIVSICMYSCLVSLDLCETMHYNISDACMDKLSA
jgi:hypothetical protein